MTPDDMTPATQPPTTRRRLLLNVGVVVTFCVVMAAVTLPNICRVRVAADRAKDTNNLKQLGLAVENYDAAMGQMIGPYAQVSPGVLNTEMSFRVSLMAYIESTDLQTRIDWTQPWDSARNAPMTSIPFKIFQSPDTPDRTKPDTPYRVFYGGGALFAADGTPVKLTDIPDGASNTILFVHATETVPWAKPQEFAYTPTTPLPPLGSLGLGKGFNAAMADGSVRFLRATIADADLRSLIEKADGRGRDIE